MQYVGKSGNIFNICCNNHRKDVKFSNTLPVDNYFTLSEDHFNNNAKFTLIEMLTNTNQVTRKL